MYRCVGAGVLSLRLQSNQLFYLMATMVVVCASLGRAVFPLIYGYLSVSNLLCLAVGFALAMLFGAVSVGCCEVSY